MSYLARAIFPADGTTPARPVTFPYLLQAHVHIYHDLDEGTTTELFVGPDWAWASAGAITWVSGHNPSGGTVRIQRVTPINALVENLKAASTVTAEPLANVATQLLYIAQERQDAEQDVDQRALRVPSGIVVGEIPNPADHSGQALVAGAGGAIVFATLGLPGVDVLGTLGGNDGAKSVGYKRPETNAHKVSLYARALQQPHLSDWSSGLGLDTVADAAALQLAVSECPLAYTLTVPPIDYHYSPPTPSGDTSNPAAALTFTRQINISGKGARVMGLFTSDVVSNLCNIRIAESEHGNGDVRRMRLSGIEIFFISGGKDALSIKNQSPMASNLAMIMDDMGVEITDTSAGYALHIEGIVTQLHEWHGGAINNGVYLDGCADACRFVNPLMGGTKLAFRVRLAHGAFRTLVMGVVCVNRDGFMLIEDGSQIDVDQCQVEQAGACLSAYNSVIAMDTSGSATNQIRNVNLTRINFGGGSNIGSNIVAETGGQGLGIEDVLMDWCTLNATASYDLRLFDTYVRNFRYGENNRLRGGGSTRGGVTITDPPGSASTNTEDQDDLIGAYATADNSWGLIGIWKGSGALTFANSWTPDSMAFKKVSSKRLTLRGRFTPGTLTAGTKITTLPPGFRSTLATAIAVPGDQGMCILGLATNGDITVVSVPNSTTTLYLDGVSFPVKSSPYNPGV